MHPDPTIIARKNPNKAQIQQICPAIPKSELKLQDDNHLLGISLGSPATLGNKIIAIFDLLYFKGITISTY